MTKGELIALVKQYLETDETTFNDNVGTFIKLMEEDVYRKVQLPKLRRNSTSNFVASTTYLETPPDYLAPYSMAVLTDDGSYEFLLEKDVNFIREAFPSPLFTGVPRFYALFDDDTFIVAPTPDQNYDVELHYFYKPESLADGDNDATSWLSTRAENACLFGTILHGYIYLKGDQDVIAMYQKQFDTALSDLVVIAEGRAKKDTYKEPNRRVPT